MDETPTSTPPDPAPPPPDTDTPSAAPASFAPPREPRIGMTVTYVAPEGNGKGGYTERAAVIVGLALSAGEIAHDADVTSPGQEHNPGSRADAAAKLQEKAVQEPTGAVNLKVFTSGGPEEAAAGATYNVAHVPYDHEKGPGTWHYPED